MSVFARLIPLIVVIGALGFVIRFVAKAIQRRRRERIEGGAYDRPPAAAPPPAQTTPPAQAPAPPSQVAPPAPVAAAAVCPACGTASKPGARFCKSCGAAL